MHALAMMTNSFVVRLRALGVLCATRGQLRAYRERFNMQGLCETHHVIPRSCSSHPMVKNLLFDVEGAGNFVLLPSTKGATRLRLRERVIHTGGHKKYNHHVWSTLDEVHDEEALCDLVSTLHRRVRYDPNIPWN